MRALKKKDISSSLLDFYNILFKSFGPQGWWPGETRFEIIIGAILTQNTAWTNVEKAIKNLKAKGLLTPEKMHRIEHTELAGLIRPAGYFNIKAKRLKHFINHLFDNYDGSLERLFRKDAVSLRQELLGINGIGPETADSIILYAASYPEFVVDAYTKRVFSRHGFAGTDISYEEMKAVFMDNLPKDLTMFNEYHALIVRLGKEYCKTQKPLCEQCPLSRFL